MSKEDWERDYDDGLIDATYAGKNPKPPPAELSSHYHRGWGDGLANGEAILDIKYGKLRGAGPTVGDLLKFKLNKQQFGSGQKE